MIQTFLFQPKSHSQSSGNQNRFIFLFPNLSTKSVRRKMRKAAASSLSTQQVKKNKDIFQKLILGTFILNIADALFSYHYISKLRLLQEANPLWIPLIYTHPMSFVVLKILLGGSCCFFLYKTSNSKTSQWGSVVCFIVYSLIIGSFLSFAFCENQDIYSK